MGPPWLIGYLILFFILAWRNYRLAFGWFILLLPAYLLRYNFGPLPTTLLELNFGVLFLVWLVKYARADWPVIRGWIKDHCLISGFIGLFLVAATLGVFTGNGNYVDPVAALLRGAGIWKAYFIEPVLLFFILLGRLKTATDTDQITPRFIIRALLFSGSAVATLAIIQLFIPGLSNPALWDDDFGGRVTSFFTSPNAIGLFIAPLIPLALALFFTTTDKKEKIICLATGLLGVLAIILARSEGAAVGLAAGMVLFVWVAGRKKTALLIAGLCLLGALVIPRVPDALLFRDQAGQNRLTLWHYTADFLTASPSHFILGAGTRKFFHEIQKPNYNPRKLERLGYPHNIFLNFWTEIGLLGALTFSGIFLLAARHAYLLTKHNPWLGTGFLAALAVIFVHGLVDVPYFKNDLAMIFWLFLALIFWLTHNYPQQQKTRALNPDS